VVNEPLIPPRFRSILFVTLVFAGLSLIARSNYLLFHSLIETFSIIVASGVFMIAWNARAWIGRHYFLFLGIALLFPSALDLIHVLAYEGMGVLPTRGGNTATQLWIASRFLQSVSLLVAPLFVRRHFRVSALFAVFGAAVSLILVAIHLCGIFPDCFIPGTGLTPFKKISEYAICFILVASVVVLNRNREAFAKEVFLLLVASTLSTIVSELAFTFYISVYGLSNLIGHYFKLLSCYLLYKAIIEMSLKKPFDLLFRNLKQNEERLQRNRDELELRVQERTSEMEKANEGLRNEISRRRKAEEEVRQSEARFRQLYDDAPVGYHEIDPEGHIIRVNRTELAMLGYGAEEMLGRPVWEFVVEEEASHRAVQEKVAGPVFSARPFERTYRRRDGSTLPVLIEDRQLLDAEGRITGIRSTLQDIKEQKETEAALQESERRLRLLSTRLLTAQETERKRIAQELHDGIGQLLTAIKFNVETGLCRDAGDKGKDEIASVVIGLLQQGVEEVRRIGMDLRPSILDDLGIVATLGWFCRRFETIYKGIRIDKEIGLDEENVPAPLKTVIYRILQESMNNIAKHSRADTVRLGLGMRDGRIEFTVRDNGQGFPVEEILSPENTERGLGLTGMRERAELTGGTFSIESSPSGGTNLRASWPCAVDDEESPSQ
jgi:PAS domain S-box-containing protein